MKKFIAFFIAGVAVSFAACNNSPQEKAEQKAEKAADHAASAANLAASQETAAAVNTVIAVVYANIAEANAAASKVPMPTFEKNSSKDLAKALGDLIVKRINVTTQEDATKFEAKISDQRTTISQKATDNKISAADKDAIIKYGDDMIAAAKAATGIK